MVELHHAISQLQQHHSPLLLPMGRLGLWLHFRVEGRQEEPIDWVDGDGGYLVAGHIPRLLELVCWAASIIVCSYGVQSDIVPFHCHDHDAIELDHVYHSAESQVVHLEYQALCVAQRAVVYTQGEVDFHGRRLV